MPPSPPQPRRPRRARHAVPADTLLTFTSYHPPPSVKTPASRPSSRPSARRNHHHFVHANLQLGLNPALDTTACQALHDENVPWTEVDVVFMHGETDCPICLYPVVCPSVTACGHVFCYVCILQCLSHTAQEGVAKCPLCASKVRGAQLTIGVFREVLPLTVGSEASMLLLARQRGTMIPHPLHSSAISGMPRNVPCLQEIHQTFYSRFAYLQAQCLTQLIQTRIAILQTYVHDADETTASFAKVAVMNMEQQLQDVLNRPLIRNHLTANIDQSSSSSSREPWYFYQSADARNIFLHPINHRCLHTEYCGAFLNAASLISAPILQIERHTMEPPLRKRYKFLEHLPDGCEFAFIELDLANVLSQQTLTTHANELRERAVARKRKLRATKREDILLEKIKSQTLQQYFTQHNAKSSGIYPQLQSVDSNDTTLFPALSGHVPSIAETESTEAAAISSEQPPIPTQPRGRWGGEVSSYSSVTSNMGFFPALSETSPLSCSPSSPATSTNAWGHTQPSSSTPSTRLSSNTSTPSVSRASSVQPEERKRRRSHARPTIFLSNAGSPYRR